MTKALAKTLLIAVALSLAACSATPVRRSFKESWNDSMTASKIRYKLMRDADVKKSRMHVQVFRGQVTLTGRAISDTEKARAEQLSKSVKRVTAVENYVHVVGGGQAATAVARAPKAGSAATEGTTTIIEEKIIVTDNVKDSTDFAPAAPARVPTIREATGSPAARPAVAGRTATVSKSEPKVANKAGKIAKEDKDAKLADVRQPTPAAKAPAAKSPASSPVISEAPLPASTPAAKVVGQSKTGLPWDGEVYEDDASSVKSSVAGRSPAPAAASANTPAKPDTSTASTSSPQPTDDLAREAAEELEKLRSKR